MKNEKITALYCRVSTYIQIKRGESIENQKSRLKRYAESSGSCSRLYVDAGFSAKDIHRPQLTRLLSDVRQGKVGKVLVTKLDRITRSIRDLISIIGLFEDFRVSFQALDQSLDSSTAAGRMQVQILGILAEWERSFASERVSESMRSRTENGKWNGGPVPFGYATFCSEFEKLKRSGIREKNALRKTEALCPEERKLYPSPEKASVVRKIFREYLRRESVRGVTSWLNSQGYKSPKGAFCTIQTVSLILRCVSYIGRIQSGSRTTNIRKNGEEKWVEAQGVHKPIIGRSVYERVQHIMSIRTKRPHRKASKFLLSGALRCICGGRMHGRSYYRSRRKWTYYRCFNYSDKSREVCKGNSVSRDAIEKTVVKCFLGLGGKDALMKAREAFENMRTKISEKKTLLNEERRKLQKAIDLPAGSKMNLAHSDFYKNMLEIEKVTVSLEGLEEMERIPFETIETFLKTLPEQWRKSDFEHRKRLLQSLIRSVRYVGSQAPLEIVISLRGAFSELSLSKDVLDLIESEFRYELTLTLPKSWERLPKPKTFGEHLRIARFKRNWMVKDLAKELQVTPETVIHWEKKGMRPDYPSIRSLKEFFPELRLLNPALFYSDYPVYPKMNGQRLKKMRLDRDLSQREFAKCLGVSADTIRDREAGRTQRAFQCPNHCLSKLRY